MRSRPAPETITFSASDTAAVRKAMNELSAAHRGWINLHPVPDDEDAVDPYDDPNDDMAPVRAGVLGWLSARGPEIPACTWVAGQERRGGPEPDSIGIQHGAGPRAVARLREHDASPPAGWIVKADHPKRGLVVHTPVPTEPSVALDWMIRAAGVLCPRSLPDRWVAFVYR